MLNRRTLLVLLVAITATGLGISAATGSEAEVMTVPMGVITISPPEGVEAKRSPVDFPHSLHFDYACNVCHHMWEYDAEVLNCSTEGCHDAIVSPLKAAAEGEEIEAYQYYKTAYHSMCISCHKEIKMKNEKLERTMGKQPDQLAATGPTGCIECHPKE